MKDDLVLPLELPGELVERGWGRLLGRLPEHAYNVASAEVIVSDIDNLNWGGG